MLTDTRAEQANGVGMVCPQGRVGMRTDGTIEQARRPPNRRREHKHTPPPPRCSRYINFRCLPADKLSLLFDVSCAASSQHHHQNQNEHHAALGCATRAPVFFLHNNEPLSLNDGGVDVVNSHSGCYCTVAIRLGNLFVPCNTSTDA